MRPLKKYGDKNIWLEAKEKMLLALYNRGLKKLSPVVLQEKTRFAFTSTFAKRFRNSAKKSPMLLGL